MLELTGTSWPVFLGLTGLLMGFAAFMTGRAVASNWKPAREILVYGLMLGFLDRFLTFALFQGSLLSPVGYGIDTAWIVAVGLFAYRITRAGKMVKQYPWLYQRHGLFGWREKS